MTDNPKTNDNENIDNTLTIDILVAVHNCLKVAIERQVYTEEESTIVFGIYNRYTSGLEEMIQTFKKENPELAQKIEKESIESQTKIMEEIEKKNPELFQKIKQQNNENTENIQKENQQDEIIQG